MKLDECNQPTQNALHIRGIIAIAIVSLIWATTFPLTKDALKGNRERATEKSP